MCVAGRLQKGQSALTHLEQTAGELCNSGRGSRAMPRIIAVVNSSAIVEESKQRNYRWVCFRNPAAQPKAESSDRLPVLLSM